MSEWISAIGVIEFEVMLYGEFQNTNIPGMIRGIIGPEYIMTDQILYGDSKSARYLINETIKNCIIPKASESSLRYKIQYNSNSDLISKDEYKIFVYGSLRYRETGENVIDWFKKVVAEIDKHEYVVNLNSVIKVTNNDGTELFA